MTQGYAKQNQSNGNTDTHVTEATPLLQQQTTTTDSLLLPLPPATITNSATITTACPDTNGNDTTATSDNDATIMASSSSSHDIGGTVNGRRRQFVLRQKLRRIHTTTEKQHSNHNDENHHHTTIMDTSDGSRESTTSSLHSHLQSFRDVSVKLMQYVAHHTGTNFCHMDGLLLLLLLLSLLKKRSYILHLLFGCRSYFFGTIVFLRFHWYIGFDGDCDQFLDRPGHVELTSNVCTEWDHTNYRHSDLCLYIILALFLTYGQYD
jgi:hypothetical protein